MTATAETVQTAPVKARQYKLPQNRRLELSFVRASHGVTLPDEVAYEETLKPPFWFTVAQHFRIGDVIELRNDSLTYWAMQMVVSADPSANYVEVRELLFKELQVAAVDQTVTDGFEATYKGVTDKWIITRTLDGHVMARGIETRREALYQIQTVMKPRLVGGR